jgi:hypothetical protein
VVDLSATVDIMTVGVIAEADKVLQCHRDATTPDVINMSTITEGRIWVCSTMDVLLKYAAQCTVVFLDNQLWPLLFVTV